MRQRHTRADIDHRPWALPEKPSMMAMTWQELLFMHWPLAPAVLRPLVPSSLQLDTFEAQAWIGVVPFRMSGVRPRYCPPLPWLSAFLELNVRTYVTIGGKPGVWFFSLDAANPVAVRLARWRFHLPYFDARMTSTSEAGGWQYRSARSHRGAQAGEFVAWYGPTGPVTYARPGTLEHWLTERYCLYAADRQARLWRGEIHHQPWPLQPAEAEVTTNTLLAPLALRLPFTAPLLHFAARLDVTAWNVHRAD
jgi:uncharacterized protein YqjF (DUF2071 family)